jgi:hypothetical protein
MARCGAVTQDVMPEPGQKSRATLLFASRIQRSKTPGSQIPHDGLCKK